MIHDYLYLCLCDSVYKWLLRCVYLLTSVHLRKLLALSGLLRYLDTTLHCNVHLSLRLAAEEAAMSSRCTVCHVQNNGALSQTIIDVRL